jgi:hypothetical protein
MLKIFNYSDSQLGHFGIFCKTLWRDMQQTLKNKQKKGAFFPEGQVPIEQINLAEQIFRKPKRKTNHQTNPLLFHF